MQQWSIDLVWWISAVEIPVVAGLFWMVWRNHHEADEQVEENRRLIDAGLAHAREALSAYKLEVAKSYASITHLKDVEHRLTEHLIRIEAKLDVAGGKA